MDVIDRSSTKAIWVEALQHMLSALDMLDETGAPGDVGSHLDLAICRLEKALGHDDRNNTVKSLRTELERAFISPPEKVTASDAPLWPSQLETAY